MKSTEDTKKHKDKESITIKQGDEVGTELTRSDAITGSGSERIKVIEAKYPSLSREEKSLPIEKLRKECVQKTK